MFIFVNTGFCGVGETPSDAWRDYCGQQRFDEDDEVEARGGKFYKAEVRAVEIVSTGLVFKEVVPAAKKTNKLPK